MDPTAVNTGIGIIAGLMTILAGFFTIRKYFDDRKPPPGPPSNAGGNGAVVKPIVVGPTLPVKPTSSASVVPGVQEFTNDDNAYRQWITDYPQGFVINTNKGANPNYMVLHKAACSHVSNFHARKEGACTERDFIKVCAVNVDPLKEWAKVHGRSDGSFSGTCGVCKPL